MYLILIASFLFFAWLTTTICVRKGLPFAVGLTLSIVLQLIGYVVALFIAAAVGRASVAPAIIILFMLPLVAGLFSFAAALLLPRTIEGKHCNATLETCACSECGRENAITTRVCPRCGNRILDP